MPDQYDGGLAQDMVITPVVEIEAADWDRFWQAVEQAADTYRSSVEPADQRAAWVAALEAICHLLRDYHDGHIRPVFMLTELRGDLEDLDEGRAPAQLLPRKGQKGRRTLNRDIADLATAAAMIDFLVESGEVLDQAARHVAKFATAIGAAMPKSQTRQNRAQDGGRALHLQLIDWRKRLRSAKKGDARYEHARQYYDIWRSAYDHKRKVDQMSGREAAASLLLQWQEMKGRKTPSRA